MYLDPKFGTRVFLDGLCEETSKDGAICKQNLPNPISAEPNTIYYLGDNVWHQSSLDLICSDVLMPGYYLGNAANEDSVYTRCLFGFFDNTIEISDDRKAIQTFPFFNELNKLDGFLSHFSQIYGGMKFQNLKTVFYQIGKQDGIPEFRVFMGGFSQYKESKSEFS